MNSSRIGVSMASLAVHLTGHSQATLTLGTSGADTDALDIGLYDVVTTSDMYVKVHATDASDVTTSTGYLIKADTVVTLFVPDQHKIGAVVASGTPTMIYHKVG